MVTTKIDAELRDALDLTPPLRHTVVGGPQIEEELCDTLQKVRAEYRVGDPEDWFRGEVVERAAPGEGPTGQPSQEPSSHQIGHLLPQAAKKSIPPPDGGVSTMTRSHAMAWTNVAA